MAGPKAKNTWQLVVIGVVGVASVSIIIALDDVSTLVVGIKRFGALLGYLAVFLASLSSNYMRELTRHFGRPFLKIHHTVSITALVALVLHAGSAAWDSGSLAAFLPVFSSAQAFFALGGRPAFWLIVITALTAFFRSRIGKNWKTIHWLNYVAFFLATAHAIMIGASFDHLVLQIVAVLMAVALITVFVLRRMAEQKRRRKRR